MQLYEKLEHDFGRWAGVENVVACSSGTAALHLALEALQLPQGSEVLVPDYTMVACARAVVMAELVPVFVDCGDDLLMDPRDVNGAIGRGVDVKSVIDVHVYGRQSMVSRTRGVFSRVSVIEDLAEAHGIPPGSYTDAACWSFYKNKIIAGEEGGAVAFREYDRATLARCLRSLGFTEAHDFQHIPRGHNYRMANCLAEKVLNGLATVGGNVSARRIYEARYDEACPPEWRMPPRQAPWVYDLRIPGLTYERQLQIVRALNSAGIEARCGFRPMSEQEEFRGCQVVGNGNAARIAPEVFYLPLVDVDRPASEVFETIRRAL